MKFLLTRTTSKVKLCLFVSLVCTLCIFFSFLSIQCVYIYIFNNRFKFSINPTNIRSNYKLHDKLGDKIKFKKNEEKNILLIVCVFYFQIIDYSLDSSYNFFFCTIVQFFVKKNSIKHESMFKSNKSIILSSNKNSNWKNS